MRPRGRHKIGGGLTDVDARRNPSARVLRILVNSIIEVRFQTLCDNWFHTCEQQPSVGLWLVTVNYELTIEWQRMQRYIGKQRADETNRAIFGVVVTKFELDQIRYVIDLLNRQPVQMFEYTHLYGCWALTAPTVIRALTCANRFCVSCWHTLQCSPAQAETRCLTVSWTKQRLTNLNEIVANVR